MFEFNEVTEETPVDELYRILGVCDYTYIETASFMEKLEEYRLDIIKRIQNAKLNINKNLDTGS